MGAPWPELKVGLVSLVEGELVPSADVFSEALPWLLERVAEGYARAPAVMLGLALLLAVPPLALAGFIIRRRAPRLDAEATQFLGRSSRERDGDDAVATGRSDGRPARPRKAWLEIVGPGGGAGSRLSLAGEVVRIGRDDENDIVLEDMTVHRHHAAINCAPDASFTVVDLAGEDGNGVVVNGRRASNLALNDGDLIELGTVKMKFNARPL